MSETIATGHRSEMRLPQRKLDVKFDLVTGCFGPDGKDRLMLSGYRVLTHITNAGIAARSSSSLRFAGLYLL